jgi:uncharacterized protein (TIGR03905 family)
MRHSYKTKDVCASKINFDLEGDIVRNIEFSGGCSGNLLAIQKLVDGFTVERIATELGGTICGRRPTSCADQLSKAVQNAYEKSAG